MADNRARKRRDKSSASRPRKRHNPVTMVQNNQESRRKYWATRSSVCSVFCTSHSFAHSALLALLAFLARSLSSSWESIKSSWFCLIVRRNKSSVSRQRKRHKLGSISCRDESGDFPRWASREECPSRYLIVKSQFHHQPSFPTSVCLPDYSCLPV